MSALGQKQTFAVQEPCPLYPLAREIPRRCDVHGKPIDVGGGSFKELPV